MKTKIFFAALVVAVLALSQTQAHAEQVPVADRTFQLPESISEGKAKQVTVLIDNSQLKLATIVLRDGTALPAHSTPVPATIQVLEGKGLIHIGSEEVSVSSGTVVVLAAGEEHDVVPMPGSDMSLMVHYLRAASSSSTSSPGAHDHGHDHDH